MRFLLTLLALLALITLAAAQPQEGDTILGKCVSVTDADTISLLVNKSVYKIRLSGIDAPERGQNNIHLEPDKMRLVVLEGWCRN